MRVTHRDGARSRRTLVAAYAVAGVAVLAPHFLGGATPVAECIILVASAAVTAYGAFCCRGTTSSATTPAYGLALLVAAAWTAAQLLPAFCSWVHPLQQSVVEQLALLPSGPALQCRISSAPGLTVVSLARLVTQLALLLLAVRLAHAGHRRLLTYAIALSSLLMACSALAHAVVGASHVYGFHQPQHARPGLLLAPLLNANHLAGHLALGFPIFAALALRTRRVDVRIATGTACFLIASANVLTLSRSGFLALMIGLVGYALVAAYHHRRRTGKVPAPALVLGFVGPLVVLILGGELLLREFRDTSSGLSKLALLGRFARLALDAPMVGAGRGAFQYVSAEAVAPLVVRAHYAENFLIHWAVEWGIPLALFLLVALLVSAATVSLRSRLTCSLALGVAALYIANLVDFSLELSGVGATAAIALGTLLASSRRPRGGRIRVPLGFSLATSAIGAVTTAAVAVPFLVAWSPRALTAELGSLLPSDSPRFAPRLARALAAYPLDPALLLLGGSKALRHDQPETLGWLNLSMTVAPSWPSPHNEAAYFLERHGRLPQAAFELGLALESNDAAASRACEFIKRHPSAALAWTLVDARTPCAIPKEYPAQCLVEVRRSDLAREFLYQLVEQDPDYANGYEKLVSIALYRRSLAEALQVAQMMRLQLPSHPSTTLTSMRAYAGNERLQDALRAFRDAPAATQRARPVLLEATRLAAQLHDGALLDELVQDLFATTTSNNLETADLHVHVASLYQRDGSMHKAFNHLQTAYDLTGNGTHLEASYELATRSGNTPVALRAATTLCHIGYRGKTYCNRSATQ